MTKPKPKAPRETATKLKSGRFRPSLVDQAEKAWNAEGRRTSWAKMTSHALEMFIAAKAAGARGTK